MVANKMADLLSLVSDLAVPDILNNTQLMGGPKNGRPPLTVPEYQTPPLWAANLRDSRSMFPWDSE